MPVVELRTNPPVSFIRKEDGKGLYAPDGSPRAILARLQRDRAKPALVPPAVDTLSRPDVPHIHLAVLAEREQLPPLALPGDALDGDVHFDLANDLSASAHTAAAPIDEVDVASSSADCEDVSCARREAEAFHAARTASRRLVRAAETSVEQTARRAQGLARLKVVREEEGSRAGEEDGRAGGMEGGIRDGQFGEVEGLKEGVVGAIDLEQSEAAVRRGGEEDLRARMEANLDDGALQNRPMSAGLSEDE